MKIDSSQTFFHHLKLSGDLSRIVIESDFIGNNLNQTTSSEQIHKIIHLVTLHFVREIHT